MNEAALRIGTVAQMVRLGHRGRVDSPGSWLRATVAAAALLALTVSVVALAVTAVAYQIRVEHDRARQPVASKAYDLQVAEAARSGATQRQMVSQAPIALVRRGDWLRDGLQHELTLLVSHQPEVPPPPGLDRWPAPGEVFLSPQLAADGAAEGIDTRYGKTVGLIGAAGLSAVDERIAYVGATPDDVSPTAVSLYEGWGATEAQPWWSPSLAGWGETTFVNPAAYVLTAIMVLALVPAAILLVAARRIGADQRRRRDLLLDALGCPPGLAAATRLGEVLTPFLVAAAATGAALAAMTTVPLRLPVVDYLLPAAYLRQHSAVLAAAAAVGLFIALACLVIGRSRPARGATRPTAGVQRVPTWTVLISPAALFAAGWLPTWMDGSGRGLWQLTYAICVLVFLIGVPPGLAVVLHVVSRGVRSVSRRREHASGLLGSSLSMAHPRSAVAVIATVAVGAGLLLQVQFAANALQGRARDAVVIAEQLHDRFLLSSFEMSNRHLERIDARLRQEAPAANLVVLSSGDRDLPATITGTCPGLSAMGQPCRNGTARDSDLLHLATLGGQALTGAGRVVIDVAPAADAPAAGHHELAVVSDGPMDIAAVKQAIMTTAWPAETPSPPIYGYAGNAFATAHQGQWAVVLGIFGLCCILVAMCGNSASEFVQRAAQLAPIAAVTHSTATLRRVAAYLLLAPIVLGAGVGVLGALWLTRIPVNNGLAPPFGGPLAVGILISASVIGVAVWLIGTGTAISVARSWTPSGQP